MSSRVKIGLIGARGRLGSSIESVLASSNDADAQIVLGIDRSNSQDFEINSQKVDVWLDVSEPTATLSYLQRAEKIANRAPYVAGATGWNEDQLKRLQDLSCRRVVVVSPNFSPGITILLSVLEKAAPLLEKWGFSSVIHEVHHTKKRDAPSGTSKAMAERLGAVNRQIYSTRASTIVGQHTVHLYGPDETLAIEHHALDRALFARGAIATAVWATQSRNPGLYSMSDVVFS